MTVQRQYDLSRIQPGKPIDDENSRRIGPGKMDWYLPEHSRFTKTGGLSSLAAAE